MQQFSFLIGRLKQHLFLQGPDTVHWFHKSKARHLTHVLQYRIISKLHTAIDCSSVGPRMQHGTVCIISGKITATHSVAICLFKKKMAWLHQYLHF